MKKVIETIQKILTDIATPNKDGDIEYQILMDTERNHYQVTVLGWEGMKRIHGILVQIDIKAGLIWVQEDNTDYGVVDELEKSGISKDKIVLGFHAPYKRPYTGYATGEQSK